MHLLSRRARPRGFTLIELLIAMVMFALLGIVVVKVVTVGQRATTAEMQRIDVQQNLRTAAAVLPAELRELDAVDGDIKTMSATSITMRAMRRLAIICTAPTTGGSLSGVTMTVRMPLYSSNRNFAAGDSIFVWYEGDGATRDDDGWLRGAATAVANQNCTDGTSGVRLTTNLVVTAPQVNLAGVVPNGSPVRGYEIVTYAVTQGADSRYYITLQTSSGTQQLIGPLTGSSGLAFTYYDANGNVTATTTAVRRIQIVVRAQSPSLVRTGNTVGYVTDSLATMVTLRNNPRF